MVKQRGSRPQAFEVNSKRETRHGKVGERLDATQRVRTPRGGFARYAGDEGKVLVGRRGRRVLSRG